MPSQDEGGFDLGQQRASPPDPKPSPAPPAAVASDEGLGEEVTEAAPNPAPDRHDGMSAVEVKGLLSVQTAHAKSRRLARVAQQHPEVRDVLVANASLHEEVAFLNDRIGKLEAENRMLRG